MLHAALEGDLVYGLASPAPPTPFVGELGDPVGDAARALTGPVLAAAGVELPVDVRMLIDGRPVATLDTPASPLLAPAPGASPTATTLTGARLLDLQGSAVTRQGDPARLAPTSSLFIGPSSQSVMSVDVSATAAKTQEPLGDLARISSSVPPRRTFSSTSPLHLALSRCSPARRIDLVPTEHRITVGDPVEVATGSVVTERIDFRQLVPRIEFHRRYASHRSGRRTVLGYGWTHSWDQAVWLEPGRVVLVEHDGRELEFDTSGLPDRIARPGDVLIDASGTRRLRCMGRLRWELRDLGSIRQFAPCDADDSPTRPGESKLVRMVDSRGTLVELDYRSDGRLARVRANGRPAFGLSHDENGRIRSVWTGAKDAPRHHVVFDYSEVGDLVRTTDCMGHARHYEYDDHLLVRETNAEGGSFFYGYDGFGPGARCIQTWGSDGSLHRVLDYDGPRVCVTDSLGASTTYEFDPAGLAVRITEPGGFVTRHRFDSAFRLVQVRFPDGRRLCDSHDEHGNLVLQEGPGFVRREQRFDSKGRLLECSAARDASWAFDYDSSGRLVRVEDPAGHQHRIEYRPGRILRWIDPEGQAIEIERDEAELVRHLRTPGGRDIRFDYDGMGRLLRTSSGPLETGLWTYDTRGRLVEMCVGNRRASLEYDREQQLLALETPDARWQVHRDALGVPRSIIGDDVRADIVHDSERRLLSVRTTAGPALYLERDQSGRVRAYTLEPWGHCELRRDEATGRITQLDEGSRRWQFEWNTDGRLCAMREETLDEEHGYDFEYRPDGLLASVRHAHGSLRLERDPVGVIVAQYVDDWILQRRAIDHRGRPYALEATRGGTPHFRASYLRNSDILERLAFVGPGEAVFDARFDRPRNRNPGWRATLDALPWIQDNTSRSNRYDALGRPIVDTLGVSLLWDEDRLLARGEELYVHHPDDGTALARFHDGRVESPPADPITLPQDPREGLLRALLDPVPASLLELHPRQSTPWAVLKQLLAPRVWDPQPRPHPGSLPWDPDAWKFEFRAPPSGTGRLGTPELRALLCPDVALAPPRRVAR